MPKLLLKFQAAVIKEIPIDKGIITVGRADDNDVIIDNPAVSGYHCKIFLSGGAFFVEDLDSTNGTFVNGNRVMKAGLRDKDAVEVVKHSLVLIDELRPDQQQEPAGTAPPAPQVQKPLASAGAAQRTACVRVVKGMVDETEHELRGLTTYIGKSDRVQIKIRGSGFFGSAPEVAAMIARRPEGYYLVPIKEGYPKLNGKNVSDKELLKEGDLIDVGGSTLQFVLKE